MSNAGRQSKNERRDVAREKARQQRERQQRRERRNRLVLQLSIGLVIVAIVAVVAVVLANSVRPAGPGPRNMANGGITITGADLKAVTTAGSSPNATPTPEPTRSGGTVLIQAWEDFGCPDCKQFEDQNAAEIQQLVKSGAAQVQYFPVAILDLHFTDRDYSTRAANAGAAVANWSPDSYAKFHALMYQDQPEEGGAGLTDAKLMAIVKQAGATHLQQIDAAIKAQTYKNWVGDRTDEFDHDGGALADVKFPASHTGAGTPTVLVNGRYYDGSTSFGSFVTSVGGAYTAAPSPTPTSSPSPRDTPAG